MRISINRVLFWIKDRGTRILSGYDTIKLCFCSTNVYDKQNQMLLTTICSGEAVQGHIHSFLSALIPYTILDNMPTHIGVSAS